MEHQFCHTLSSRMNNWGECCECPDKRVCAWHRFQSRWFPSLQGQGAAQLQLLRSSRRMSPWMPGTGEAHQSFQRSSHHHALRVFDVHSAICRGLLDQFTIDVSRSVCSVYRTKMWSCPMVVHSAQQSAHSISIHARGHLLFTMAALETWSASALSAQSPVQSLGRGSTKAVSNLSC